MKHHENSAKPRWYNVRVTSTTGGHYENVQRRAYPPSDVRSLPTVVNAKVPPGLYWQDGSGNLFNGKAEKVWPV